MENKIQTLIFALALVLLVSMVSVSAFGVGSAYTSDNPLKLYPGESSEISISLQNNEAISLKGSIIAGSDIARFIDVSDVYNVPADGSINAKLEVSVPRDADIGQEYIVTMSFLGVPGAQGGTVGFANAMEKSFKVVVVEKPTTETTGISTIWWILSVILIIGIIAVVYFLVKSKKD